MYENLIRVNPNKITTVRYAYTRFFGRVYNDGIVSVFPALDLCSASL